MTYSLKGGAAQAYYCGGGIDGPVGNTITNFVEAELFKFGSGEPTQAVAAIDRWRLTAIPELTSVALLAIASFGIISCSRRIRS